MILATISCDHEINDPSDHLVFAGSMMLATSSWWSQDWWSSRLVWRFLLTSRGYRDRDDGLVVTFWDGNNDILLKANLLQSMLTIILTYLIFLCSFTHVSHGFSHGSSSTWLPHLFVYGTITYSGWHWCPCLIALCEIIDPLETDWVKALVKDNPDYRAKSVILLPRRQRPCVSPSILKPRASLPSS